MRHSALGRAGRTGLQMVRHVPELILSACLLYLWDSQRAQSQSPPANAGDIVDAGSVPVSGRSPGGGSFNPLQDTVCGVLESQTQLSTCTHTHTHTHTHTLVSSRIQKSTKILHGGIRFLGLTVTRPAVTFCKKICSLIACAPHLPKSVGTGFPLLLWSSFPEPLKCCLPDYNPHIASDRTCNS